MVFGDAESSSGVKREFNRHKDPKAKMTTNSDKNTKKPCKFLSTDLQV